MILTNKFIVDGKKVQDGVWVELDGARFLLAYYGSENLRFMQQVAMNQDKLLKPSDTKEVFDEQQALEVKLFVDSVLLDWEGVYLNEGDAEPIPYSKEKAVEVLTQFVGLRSELAALASDQAKFHFQKEAELVKN